MNGLASGLLRGIETGDFDLLRSLFAEDVIWWTPPSAPELGLPRPVSGREDVVFVVGGGRGTFEPGTTKWTVHGVLESEDEVPLWVVRTGRTARGHDYENEYVLWLRIAHGEIAEVWEHVDTARFASLVNRT